MKKCMSWQWSWEKEEHYTEMYVAHMDKRITPVGTQNKTILGFCSSNNTKPLKFYSLQCPSRNEAGHKALSTFKACFDLEAKIDTTLQPAVGQRHWQTQAIPTKVTTQLNRYTIATKVTNHWQCNKCVINKMNRTIQKRGKKMKQPKVHDKTRTHSKGNKIFAFKMFLQEERMLNQKKYAQTTTI